MSITGLYWLTEEFETVADLPGRWRADADAVYVEGIDGTERLEPVEGAPGLLVEAGDRRIEVIRRTGSVGVARARSEVAAPAGLPRDPHLRAERTVARRRHSSPRIEPKTVTTGAVVEGLEHHHNAVGVIDFELAGTAAQLVAFGARRAICTCCSPMPPAA